MPIKQILSLTPTKILALNQEGCLISWDLSAQKLALQNIKDFPFLKHQWHEKVLQSKAIALLKVQDWIVVCGEKEIKFGKLEEVVAKFGKNGGNIQWKSLRNQDGIQCMIVLQKQLQNQQQMQDQNSPSSLPILLFSTKSSKLYSLQLPQPQSSQNPYLLCNISEHCPPSSSLSTHSHHSWNEYITCMTPFRDHNLLLIGTNFGRILIINLINRKVVEDVTHRNNVKGGACTGIFVSSGGHRFYSLHQKGVFQWSMELQKCQGYYAYSNPYCAAYTEKIGIDSAKIIIAGGSKFLEIIDSEDAKKLSQIQTNIDCISVIKEIDNKIYLGGSHNSIQILQSGIAYLILFKSEQSCFI